MFKRNAISLSKLSPFYYPYCLLDCITVKFNDVELGINGPEGLKEAHADKGYIILNNGRVLKGNVEIIEEPPF